jgi:hypothetical protein
MKLVITTRLSTLVWLMLITGTALFALLSFQSLVPLATPVAALIAYTLSACVFLNRFAKFWFTLCTWGVVHYYFNEVFFIELSWWQSLLFVVMIDLLGNAILFRIGQNKKAVNKSVRA